MSLEGGGEALESSFGTDLHLVSLDSFDSFYSALGSIEYSGLGGVELDLGAASETFGSLLMLPGISSGSASRAHEHHVIGQGCRALGSSDR